jgi:hypothetical protein
MVCGLYFRANLEKLDTAVKKIYSIIYLLTE